LYNKSTIKKGNHRFSKKREDKTDINLSVSELLLKDMYTWIMHRLEGKVAIITGGASGFGEATARLFVKHGGKVIIADVQDEKGIGLCNDVTSSTNDCDNFSISYTHCNVTDDTDVKNVVNIAVSKYGKLDIMFNNAGISGNA